MLYRSRDPKIIKETALGWLNRACIERGILLKEAITRLQMIKEVTSSETLQTIWQYSPQSTGVKIYTFMNGIPWLDFLGNAM